MQESYRATGASYNFFVLSAERLLPALLALTLVACFSYTLATSLPSLMPREIRIQSNDVDSPYFDDFVVFFAAGRLATSANPYELAAIHEEETVATRQDGSQALLPFFNPPTTLLPLTALALLPLSLAAGIWSALGLGAFGATLASLARPRITNRGGNVLLIWLLGVGSSLPFVQAVVHGQMTFFLAGGFCLLWMSAFRERRPVLAAVALTVLSAKPALLVTACIWLLVSRQWRSLALFFAGQVVLVAATLPLFGLMQTYRYADLSLRALSWDETNGISSYGMFGWHGLLRGLVGPGRDVAKGISSLLLDLGTIAVLYAYLKRTLFSGTKEACFGAVIFAALLISPHSYSQDLLFTVPALVLLSTADRDSSKWIFTSIIFWITLRVHFSLLHVSGIGPANIALVVMFGLLVAQGNRQFSVSPFHAVSQNRGSWLAWPATSTLFAGLVGILILSASMKTPAFTRGYYPLSPSFQSPSETQKLPTVAPSPLSTPESGDTQTDELPETDPADRAP
jgi:hypothetical protein